MTERMLAGQIDALLPQTQCAKCGYSACMPYAEAIAAGEADINQCPPGGEAGIGKLARLLQQSAKPLNPANGAARPRTLAFIDEARCIGCTLCIQACRSMPSSARPSAMHTVIAELCTAAICASALSGGLYRHAAPARRAGALDPGHGRCGASPLSLPSPAP